VLTVCKIYPNASPGITVRNEHLKRRGSWGDQRVAIIA